MGQILDIFGASKARKAQERAADKSIAASTAATDRTLALQRDMFDRVWTGTAVQRDAGDAATRMMAQLMGLHVKALEGLLVRARKQLRGWLGKYQEEA